MQKQRRNSCAERTNVDADAGLYRPILVRLAASNAIGAMTTLARISVCALIASLANEGIAVAEAESK